MEEQTHNLEEISAESLIEEARSEGVGISVPSNSISKELADKIREKYFPKKDTAVSRAVKIVKQAAATSDEPPVETQGALAEGDLGEIIVTDKELVHITIPSEQLERLSGMARKILKETTLAQERITKDQHEIDLLKTETRETLRRLRAA